VSLLRRRQTATPAEPAPAEAPPGADSPADNPRFTAAKGRPTPTRREAQGRRAGPVPPPPLTRRQAYRRQKELRGTRRAETAERLRAGDESGLTRRDRGPERRLVRDIVDSRRNAGGAFLFVALLVLASYAVPSTRFKQLAVLIWMATFLMMVFDSVLVGLRIRRLVRERFPDTGQRTAALIAYGVNRTIMIRRWRLPAPQVAVGDKI
jgi:hypothetical protein